MTSTDPGERRKLSQAPGARYAAPTSGMGAEDAATGGSALAGPLLRAVVVAAIGAVALLLVGAVFASTFGLLFVGAGMGTAVGLVLARAAVPGNGAGRPVARATVGRLAILVALAAVVGADIGIWVFARSEGGTLGLLDYLWTTFGPFVPGVAVAAAVAAAWGANAGPVQR